MDKKSILLLEMEKYRKENNITGNYIELKCITNNKTDIKTEKKYEKTDENILKNIEYIKDKLRPINICLYTKKKYHILCCPITWAITMITDDLIYFNEETYDNWLEEKGKLKNLDCWEVLNWIQGDISFQSWYELYPKIMNDILNKTNVY